VCLATGRALKGPSLSPRFLRCRVASSRCSRGLDKSRQDSRNEEELSVESSGRGVWASPCGKVASRRSPRTERVWLSPLSAKASAVSSSTKAETSQLVCPGVARTSRARSRKAKPDHRAAGQGSQCSAPTLRQTDALRGGVASASCPSRCVGVGHGCRAGQQLDATVRDQGRSASAVFVCSKTESISRPWRL